jgi:hypothetical protein
VFEHEPTLTLPTPNIINTLAFCEVGGLLTFDFSSSQVSEMLISCHVSSGSNGSNLIVILHFVDLEDGSRPLSSSHLYWI